LGQTHLRSAKKGAWKVEGDQILFFNDSDLDRFTSYIESIQKLVNQEEEFRRQGVQRVKRNFDRTKEELKLP